MLNFEKFSQIMGYGRSGNIAEAERVASLRGMCVCVCVCVCVCMCVCVCDLLS